MENLIFRHGRIFLAKCDLYHSIHIDDLQQNVKCCQEDMLLLKFSVESAENWEKQ